MSDLPVDGMHPDLGGPSQVPSQGSPGGELKALREARGLTLSEVSARIKYSSVQLGYLESDAWDGLPHGVPLRGMVRNYARFLEADVDALLQQLDHAVGPTGPQAVATALAPRRVQPRADFTPRGEPAHRTWAWLLLILLLFCAVGFYAIDRGWVPDQWLIFDWLKALRP